MSRTHAYCLRTVLVGLTVFASDTALGSEHVVPKSGPTDPRLKLAKLTKEEIERQEKELAEILERVSTAIDRMASDKIDEEQDAIDGLRKVVAGLRTLAKELVEMYSAYEKSTGLLKTSMEKAVPVFREASKVFLEYAEEEPFREIKQDYLFTARAWSDMADVMAKRAAVLSYSPAEMADAVKYLERSALFLERFDSHLASYPNLDAGVERQRYLEQMRQYMHGMSQLRKLFQNFHNSLKSRSLAIGVRPPKKKVEKNTIIFVDNFR